MVPHHRPTRHCACRARTTLRSRSGRGAARHLHAFGSDRPPVKAAPPVADISTGIYAAYGVCGALFERERSGEGQRVETSLLQAQIFMLDFQAARWLIAGGLLAFAPDGRFLYTSERTTSTLAVFAVDPGTGQPHTAHTTNPVPFHLIDEESIGAKLTTITGQKPIRHSRQAGFQIVDVIASMRPLRTRTSAAKRRPKPERQFSDHRRPNTRRISCIPSVPHGCPAIPFPKRADRQSIASE